MGKNTGIVKGNAHELETEEPKSAAELAHIPGLRKAQHARVMTEADRKARGMKAETFVSLEDGDQVEGIFLGKGGDASVNSRDPKKPEKQSLPTFRIQVSETVVVRLLGSANLVGQLSGLDVGTHVCITRLGQVVKGSNVTAYGVETGKTYDPATWSPEMLPGYASNGQA